LLQLNFCSFYKPLERNALRDEATKRITTRFLKSLMHFAHTNITGTCLALSAFDLPEHALLSIIDRVPNYARLTQQEKHGLIQSVSKSIKKFKGAALFAEFFAKIMNSSVCLLLEQRETQQKRLKS
jgi:hypothetical protein